MNLLLLAAGSTAAAIQENLRPPEYLTCDCPHVYVDALLGEDTDLCGPDPALPCRTIQAAIDRIPMVFTRDITVHVAPGTYPGGILIAGRTTPGQSRLRVAGTDTGAVISGPYGEPTGIAVVQSRNVSLENLEVTGYPAAGVRVILSPGSRLESVTLSNNGDGAFLGESETLITKGLFRDNLGHGLACEGGWVTLSGHLDSHAFVDNGVGLKASGCHASLQSPIHVAGSLHGLLAVHGGEIDLNLRTDISLSSNPGGSPLTADCHGMITGFENTCEGSCACTAVRFGICEPARSPARGGGNRSILYREN
jgi:hypothetical protein